MVRLNAILVCSLTGHLPSFVPCSDVHILMTHDFFKNSMEKNLQGSTMVKSVGVLSTYQTC